MCPPARHAGTHLAPHAHWLTPPHPTHPPPAPPLPPRTACRPVLVGHRRHQDNAGYPRRAQRRGGHGRRLRPLHALRHCLHDAAADPALYPAGHGRGSDLHPVKGPRRDHRCGGGGPRARHHHRGAPKPGCRPGLDGSPAVPAARLGGAYVKGHRGRLCTAASGRHVIPCPPHLSHHASPHRSCLSLAPPLGPPWHVLCAVPCCRCA